MAARFDDAWIERASQQVLAEAHRHVRAHAVGDEQRRLQEKALGDMRLHHAPLGMYLPSVHLPLLVSAAIRGDEDDPIGIALCTALLEQGMDLLDHVADREIGAHWQGWEPESIQVGAIVAFAALAPLALAELGLPGERRAVLQARLAKGLVAIAAGQQLDLELASSRVPELAQVERANHGKTGERRALYAELAALHAGAEESACAAYATFGREIGMAYQVASDLYDLFGEDDSRDLRNGARTWPIAWALSRLEGDAHRAMLALLDAARDNPAARQSVLAAFREQGVAMRSMLQVESHFQRARQALEQAAPKEPARTALLAMASNRPEAEPVLA